MMVTKGKPYQKKIKIKNRGYLGNTFSSVLLSDNGWQTPSENLLAQYICGHCACT